MQDTEYIESVAYQLFIRGYNPEDVEDYINGIRYGDDPQIDVTLGGISKSELEEIKDCLEDMILSLDEE